MLVRIVNALGCKTLDRLGQQPGIIGNLHLLDLLATDVQHWILAFGQLPFERGLFAVDIEALSVLPCGVEQKASDFESEVLIANLEMRAFE